MSISEIMYIWIKKNVKKTYEDMGFEVQFQQPFKFILYFKEVIISIICWR